MDERLIIGIVCIGYVLIFVTYWYVTNKIIEVADAKGVKDSKAIKQTFVGSTTFIFLMFWIYKYWFSSETNPMLGTDHIWFILVMAFYFYFCLGILTNSGFNWVILIGLVIAALIILPIIAKKGSDSIFGSPTSSTTAPDNSVYNIFSTILYPFYTSYGFLFSVIILGLILLYTFVKKFNIPNLNTWQLWATIASIVFGIKYILLYRFTYSNLMTILGFLALVTVLIFLMIQPTVISQITLTFIFSLACIIFAIILPMDIPYLGLGFFMVSIAAAICLGLFTQRVGFSSVQVLYAIFSLYLVIHFSNSLNFNTTAKKPSVTPTAAGVSTVASTPTTGGGIADLATTASTYLTDKKVISVPIGIYIITWGLITTLYFIDLGGASKYQNIATLASSITLLILPVALSGLMMYFGKWFTEGAWFGILITFVGLLLMTYYFLSTIYSSHLNFSIVFLILMFVGFSLMLMLYNLKSIFKLFLFILSVGLFILFVYLLKNSKDWMGISGGVFLMFIWCLVNILFWNSSGLKVDNILNATSLSIFVSGFLLYLVFYYTYLTFTSKKSVSQKFSQIALIVMCSYVFLQIFKKSSLASNPFVAFVINVIEYIPCLYDNFITQAVGQTEASKEDFSYHSLGTKILASIIIFIALYYSYPTLRKWLFDTIQTPGVTLIGDTPLSTNETHLIKTYEELTSDPEKPIYNYSISFDLFIIPSSGNDIFHNIVDFTGNLFVTYNTVQNQLYIYAIKDDTDDTHVTLYRYTQFPLQKWVNIEIKYLGGTYDVFVDNKLKTSNAIVSANTHENIYVGETGSSVIGKVKNFTYYEKHPFL
jgi:hypothetical protein